MSTAEKIPLQRIPRGVWVLRFVSLLPLFMAGVLSAHQRAAEAGQRERE